MNGFKQCAKGHFYKEDIPSCPYCPSGTQSTSSSSSNMDRTVVPGNGNIDDKTQVFGGQSGNSTSQSTVFGSNLNASDSNAAPRDLNRTYIAGVTDSVSADGSTIQENAPRAARKIVGWILSYTYHM